MSKGSDLTLGGKLIDLFAQNVFGLRVLLTHWISSNVLPAYRNGISRIKCCSPQSMVLDKRGAGFDIQIGGGEGIRTPVFQIFQTTVYMLFTFNIRTTIMCKCVVQIPNLMQLVHI